MKDISNCIYCKSIKVVKNGKIGVGQRFRCYDCNHDFSLGSKRGTIPPSIKDKIVVKFCHDHVSVRKLSSEFDVATSSIISWAKGHKKQCNICCNSGGNNQS